MSYSCVICEEMVFQCFQVGLVGSPGSFHAQLPPSEKAFALHHKLLSNMSKVKCDSKHWLHTVAFNTGKAPVKTNPALMGKGEREGVINFLLIQHLIVSLCQERAPRQHLQPTASSFPRWVIHNNADKRVSSLLLA